LKELNVYGTGLKENKMKHGTMKAQMPQKTSAMWPNPPKKKGLGAILSNDGDIERQENEQTTV
jgi:hypothetical protein